jgi:hypothetical protein
MSQWGTKCNVLSIFVLALFNCAENSNPPILLPKAESPVGIKLHLGMTIGEVPPLQAADVFSPFMFRNRFGQIILVERIYFFKTEADRAAGKKTGKEIGYWLYYVRDKDSEFRLVYWSVESDWRKDEAILMETRFKIPKR